MDNILYLEQFGKAFVPERVRPELREYLLKAGVNEVPYKFFGGLFWVTLVITYLIYFSLIFNPISTMGSFIVLIMTFISWFVLQTAIVFFTIMIVKNQFYF